MSDQIGTQRVIRYDVVGGGLRIDADGALVSWDDFEDLRDQYTALLAERDALIKENCRLTVTADRQSKTIAEAISEHARLVTERGALAAQAEALLVNAQKTTEKYDASRLHFHTHFGPSTPLYRFLDAAGGEGYVLGGVDAGDLVVALYGYSNEIGEDTRGT